MTGRHAFGPFVLDCDTRELRRSDQPVALSPKAFQLLEILVERRPKALSKADLQDRLWPDTFVVEKNLSNLASEIREALGDDAAQPRFLRTVRRFGYAFHGAAPLPQAPAGDERSAAPRFRLVWADGRSALGDGAHVLGRDPDLELFLDSPSVSRRHALIRVAGPDATLEDLGSKNGTFVGTQRIDRPTSLRHNDLIRLGSMRLTFKVIRGQGSTRTEHLL